MRARRALTFVSPWCAKRSSFAPSRARRVSSPVGRACVALAALLAPSSFAPLASVAFAAPPAAAPAAAPEGATAAESFRQGTAAYGKRDYRNAAAAFERAYRIAPHGSPLYNAGLAWEAANEPARAADAHEGALAAGGLTPAQTRSAQTRLAALEAQLGRLDVTGPEGAVVTVAHVDRAPVPVKIHLAPGEYDVRASFDDGATSEERVSVSAGVPLALTVKPPPPPPPPPPEPAPPAPVAKAAPEESGGGPSQRIGGFVAIGGGVILAAAGAFVGLRALSARDDFNASGHTDADAHDRAASERIWSTVFFVGAAAAAGAGLALVLTAPSSKASASASISILPGTASLRVSY